MKSIIFLPTAGAENFSRTIAWLARAIFLASDLLFMAHNIESASSSASSDFRIIALSFENISDISLILVDISRRPVEQISIVLDGNVVSARSPLGNLRLNPISQSFSKLP